MISSYTGYAALSVYRSPQYNNVDKKRSLQIGQAEFLKKPSLLITATSMGCIAIHRNEWRS